MMYLLKFLGASILLYGIYHFLLRNERTFKFNRFYLLSILVLAAIIPLVIVKTTVVEIPYQEPILNAIPEELPQIAYSIPSIEEDPALEINWTLVGQVSYGVIALMLFMRFLLNLRAIRILRKSGEEITFKKLPLVQSQKVKTTFSFLSRIFVNEAQFKKDGLADEILAHERVHIQQRHSLDVIFMELVACLIWFNPVVYLIRRNIKLNHEYLADAGVIAQSKDPNAYQLLLLKYTGKQMILNPLLASHLSYGETKQRFKIMFKTTNKRVAALKQFAALTLIAGLFFAFGEERVVAQQQEKDLKQKSEVVEVQLVKKNFEVPLPPPPPPMVFKLKPDTPTRFVYANGESVKGDYGKLSERSKKIFESPEGKGEVYIPRVTILTVVQQSTIDKYADKSKYRVWVDKKEINADDLKSYKPQMFGNYYTGPAYSQNESKIGNLEEKVIFETKEYIRKRDENAPKGTWEPYHPSMSPDYKISSKQNLDVPPPPPPQKVKKELPPPPPPPIQLSNGELLSHIKVRFRDENGEMVIEQYGKLTDKQKKSFKDPSVESEFFSPPPPAAYLTDEMIKEFKDTKTYGVWLDGVRIENRVLDNYKAGDFHHYFKGQLKANAVDYGKYTYHIDLITRQAWDKNPASKGAWIEYKRPRVIHVPKKNQGNQSLSDSKKSNNSAKQDAVPSDYKWGQGPTKEQAAKHERKVETFLTVSSNHHIKMTLPNGKVLVKKAKDYTREEWYRWWDPAYKGMIFSPPQKEITFEQLEEWKENPDKYTVSINFEPIKNLNELSNKRFAFSEITEARHNGKTVVELTPKEKYLDSKYFDTAWRSNVIYKN